MLDSYPVLNISEKTLHPEVAITQPGLINYTVLIKDSCHCAAEFVIVASDMDVEMVTVFFSKSLVHVVWYVYYLIIGTYMIQSCHVTILDHTSIMVTCTLVVNANFTGLVVVENAATDETMEKRLLLQSNSVIFTSLEPGAQYRVRAYDDTTLTTAAYEESLVFKHHDTHVTIVYDTFNR